jgi:epoxyqueuosine reductase
VTSAGRDRVVSLVRESGFDLVRIAPAQPLHREKARYLRWVEAGRQGEMRWITPEWVERAADPQATVPEARSVVCVGLAYRAVERAAVPRSHGLIARYAWGADYHAVIGEMLERAAGRLTSEFGGAHRWYVDAGATMDKALAARAGLGWYGKNTNILTEEFGSYVLLGEIITTLDIEPDLPLGRDCGSCRLCMVACPTGALGPDYSIDSRRCISYLTIEHRGPIPLELRPLMGAWIFGCDICQDVCPPSNRPYLASEAEKAAWRASLRQAVNAGSVPAATQGPGDAHNDLPGSDGGGALPPVGGTLLTGEVRQSVDLVALLRLTHSEYLEMFRGTSVRRAKVWMLRRNAAVALGNVGTEDALIALEEALRGDDSAIVRGHAAWAIGRIGERLHADVHERLQPALRGEADPSVVAEIEQALATTSPA